jgi:hypothetical protein
VELIVAIQARVAVAETVAVAIRCVAIAIGSVAIAVGCVSGTGVHRDVRRLGRCDTR